MVPRATIVKIASHIRTPGMFYRTYTIPVRCVTVVINGMRRTIIARHLCIKELWPRNYPKVAYFRRSFAKDAGALQNDASYQRSHEPRPLHSPIYCLCRSRTAKVAVTTDKTSGLRMAVKSISTYTADLGAMVRACLPLQYVAPAL